jgi:hypothetical protein
MHAAYATAWLLGDDEPDDPPAPDPAAEEVDDGVLEELLELRFATPGLGELPPHAATSSGRATMAAASLRAGGLAITRIAFMSMSSPWRGVDGAVQGLCTNRPVSAR